jgi:hypothetical protein
MLTLVKDHIRNHKVLDDVSLEKNEGRSVTLTLRNGGGSEKQRLVWQDYNPLAIFEDLFLLLGAQVCGEIKGGPKEDRGDEHSAGEGGVVYLANLK